jgi:hypothetical protein
MELERIELSQRERDRLKVLYEVEQGHLTQVQAAARARGISLWKGRVVGQVDVEAARRGGPPYGEINSPLHRPSPAPSM